MAATHQFIDNGEFDDGEATDMGFGYTEADAEATEGPAAAEAEAQAWGGAWGGQPAAMDEDEDEEEDGEFDGHVVAAPLWHAAPLPDREIVQIPRPTPAVQRARQQQRVAAAQAKIDAAKRQHHAHRDIEPVEMDVTFKFRCEAFIKGKYGFHQCTNLISVKVTQRNVNHSSDRRHYCSGRHHTEAAAYYDVNPADVQWRPADFLHVNYLPQ